MCLLSLSLDSVGLFLRIWLWISVPMAVVILLVATWLNYRRNIKPKLGLRLAMEGWGGEGLSGGGGAFMGGDESFTGGDSGRDAEADEVETGSDKIYRGILWMKEKYEQYREQADRRYESMREELVRSERRYQELVGAMLRSRDSALGTVTDNQVKLADPVVEGMTAGEGEIIAGPAGEVTAGEGEFDLLGEAGNGAGLVTAGGGEVLQSELQLERLKVQDLERELRAERLKTEELVVKLQANSQLLMTIYQELDKSLTPGNATAR
jgi:hypothetical protein